MLEDWARLAAELDLPREAAGTEPHLSVIIPHYEQPQLLGRCLESLHAQRGAPPFEIIVVDNGSATVPVEICRRFPCVRLMSETVKGPGPARNRGAAAARAPILLFIDADCVADADWMATAARLVREQQDIGIWGGDIRILPADPARLSPIECYEELYGYRPELMIRHFHFAVTCNLVVRRALFEAIGPFIPGLVLSEDVEWGRRAHARGHRIAFVPDLRIATPARSDFSEVARRWDRQVGQQHAEMMLKPFGRLRWLIKTLAMPLSPIAELPAILGTPRLRRSADRAGAFQVLVGTRLWRTVRMVQLLLGAVENVWLTGAWRRPPAASPTPVTYGKALAPSHGPSLAVGNGQLSR
jgi:hypothetical protein